MSITTTGVKAESYDHGMAHLLEFASRVGLSRYNYAMLMEEEDGTYTIVERIGMPCWGAFREYGCGTRADEYWPDDLRGPEHIFPKTGKVSAIAFINNGNKSKDGHTEERNRFKAEFTFNPDVSPWRCLLKDFEHVIVDGEYHGVVFKDCNFEPTVLASFLRITMNYAPLKAMTWCKRMKAMGEKANPAVAFLKDHAGGYGMSGRVVLERFFTAQPFDLTDGGTLYNRDSYNRTDRDYVFGGKDNEGVIPSEMSVEDLLAAYNDAINVEEAAVIAA